jgi:hypothetical protein
MSEPSSNMKAVLVIAQNKNIGPIITPALNIERDSINWEMLRYGGQSGGVQAALSWAYCLFCDELPPKDWNYRDPFEGFFSLDREIQVLILQAMAARHGFINLIVEDRPKSDFQKLVEDFGKHMADEEKRKGFKVVKSDEEN